MVSNDTLAKLAADFKGILSTYGITSDMAADELAHRALTAQAPTMPADFAPRLMAVVKIYQEQAALGMAVDAELFRAVSRLVAAQALPAAEPVQGLREQHDRDSKELRSLCQARDEARRERDLGRVEIAGLNSSVGHLSALVDHQSYLLAQAMQVMKALHGSATPDDGPEMDAIIPADAFAKFVDDNARLMHLIAHAPFDVKQAAQAAAGWVPIEAAEEGVLYVVSWVDPEDGLERHDFDALEGGVWQQHTDNVEHFQMCAPSGSRGPKDQPPYTHCLKLGALPQPQSAQAKGDA